MDKTHHGSCHCGAVKYRVALDLAQGTGRCNCSYCLKTRSWSARAEPAGFALLAGEEVLGDYAKSWPGGEIHHRFCTRCGVTLYGHGRIEEMGGEFLSVHVNTLDDADIDALMAGPLRYFDGRNDNWMNPPADIRHL